MVEALACTLTEGVMKTMWLNKGKAISAIIAVSTGLAGSGLLAHQVPANRPPVAARAPEEPKPPAADESLRPVKVDLKAESFAELHGLIRPHPNEWRHLKVEWLTEVVAARKKAAAEDKPIIICYTGGAGYNEPLGVC
jgi:hypothetical protein